MTFPVGHTVLIEYKEAASKPNPIDLFVDRWVKVGTIELPSGGEFLATMQLRIPAGYWAKTKFVRVGWGSDPGGLDVTGLHPWRPCPDGKAFSDSFSHPLSGGGPLACYVKLLHPSELVNSKVRIPTCIYKVKRLV